jgi:Radical SAM superfamily
VPVNKPTDQILLINCPFGDYQAPYLGLADIASYLNHNRIDARVLDLNLALWEKLGDPSLWDRRFLYTESEVFEKAYPQLAGFMGEYVAWIASLNLKLIGFTVHAYNLLFVNKMAQALTESFNPQIIMGGPSVRLLGERQKLFDSDNIHFVRGRGEPAILPLLSDIREGRAKKLYEEGDFPPVEDDGAITTFDEFELSKYPGKTLPLLYHYGCSRRCAYCNEPRFNDQVRTKPLSRITNEIFYFKEKLGHNFFEFMDLAINVRHRKFAELLNAMVEGKTEIVWTANAIPSAWFTPEHAALTKKAGCDFLRFGLESGSDKVLAKMRKPFRLKQVRTALENCTAAGIKTGVNLIVGFPGEGEAEFAETLAFLAAHKHLIHRVDNIFTCYVSGESALEKNPAHFGIELPREKHWYEWSTSDGRNTFEIRKQRHAQLLRFLEEEGITFGTPDVVLNRHLMLD